MLTTGTCGRELSRRVYGEQRICVHEVLLVLYGSSGSCGPR
jgi:hypothetical protein